MRRPYRVLAQLMGAGVLMGATACTLQEQERPRGFPEAATVEETTASASPTATALTDARARSALLREGDLGDTWTDTQGAATWRDGLLKGRTDPPGCQKLLDTFYAEDLLGEPKGGTAVTGFDDDEYGAQLRYQVGAYNGADVDARLTHFRQLAEQCQAFTITGLQGQEYGAQITPVDLPDDLGDAGQALRLTIRGDIDGGDGTLTLDLATVRVGDTAALLTHGGLHGIDDTATRNAARAGAERLRQVLGAEEDGGEEEGGASAEEDEDQEEGGASAEESGESEESGDGEEAGSGESEEEESG
ncbi:hypothetical protein [Streptomyces ipomoeae]|uniref:hypothetical protein n=1 Tax=Streptomyces ipomoeae TaxID=103232 RepID=UPI0011470505|nr:hypothetical protein [Streptomyces ipomoeae]MDX2932342.1 hypothetical protein [Streptomyces ipomoeae]TQE27044.1 hypothetical protein SipoB123_12745 [Streptomyces ipomoeae]